MKRRHSNTTMDTMFTFKVGICAALHCFGDNGDIGINLKNKKYAIRSRYFSEISDSIETIDLPYLPQNRATYNLGSGAYLIDL
ncbi:MAG: hypothetical protein P8H43_04700 [Crocinitomicaceae bacterium]|nr:hypothetical protein [Crocinitomicaceae bacterium]